MNKQPSSNAALGLYVTQSTVEAVLLTAAGGRVQFVRRFVRPRIRRGEAVAAGSFETALPGLRGSDDADYTIEVGDGRADVSSPFLASEFDELKGGDSAPAGEEPAAPAAGVHASFEAQLREILGECAKLGYPDPPLAFCVAPPDVTYVELAAPAAEKDGDGGRGWFSRGGSSAAADGMDRRALLKRLQEHHAGPVDAERVAFLPMTAALGRPRYLALAPAPGDSATATLEALREARRNALPTARLIDTEASLYLDMVRAYHPADAEQNTALVRVGAEDTLVLFLKGTELRHCERLRSLSSYDAPETICSRVLLQQDEQKVGALHNVLVLSTGREERLLEGFREFYPDAAVQSLHQILLEGPLAATGEATGDSPLTPGTVPAAGAALRLLDTGAATGPRAHVNLLPARLQRKPRRRPVFAWHTLAMLAVLFGVTLFFTWRYVEGQEAIEQRQEELRRSPVEVPEVAPVVLKARVDSLLATYGRYTHALGVLDSLLIGSDKWSRMLSTTSTSTGTIRRIWFTGWNVSGSQLRLDGVALSRGSVAVLARRLDGVVERLDFSEVETESGDVRVHPFTITAPVPETTPQVAQYLQDVADGHIITSGSNATHLISGSDHPHAHQ